MGQNLAKIKSLYEDEQQRARLRHQLLQDKVLDYLLQPTTMNVKKEGKKPPARKSYPLKVHTGVEAPPGLLPAGE